jgi:hypothetical protein
LIIRADIKEFENRLEKLKDLKYLKSISKKIVTGMVHRSAYLCIFRYKYTGAYIRSAAPTRFGLAPHLPLIKTSADP